MLKINQLIKIIIESFKTTQNISYDNYFLGSIDLQFVDEAVQENLLFEDLKYEVILKERKSRKNFKKIIIKTSYQEKEILSLSLSLLLSEKDLPDFSEGEGDFSFSRVELEDFLEKTKDKNSLHKKKEAVVPGLMILVFIIRNYMNLRKVKSIKARFINPLYIKECFSIKEDCSLGEFAIYNKNLKARITYKCEENE